MISDESTNHFSPKPSTQMFNRMMLNNNLQSDRASWFWILC